MSVAREYVVRCSEAVAILCEGAIAVGHFEVSKHPLELARAAAALRGWVNIGKDAEKRDICPACRHAITDKAKRRPKMTQATSERKEAKL